MVVNYRNLRKKSRMWLHPRNMMVSTLIVCSSFSLKAETRDEKIPLFGNLGTHHYPISTSVPAAQRYFDQGLILAFGFNHAEAARSFRQAYQLDPKCALCYWGEALVLGPNINAQMDPSAVKQAYQAAQQSLYLADSVTDKEKALIRALSTRYSKEAPEDRTQLDEAYAAAMRRVAQRYPDDAVLAALLAESLMDLHPWDFWTIQGKARPWTAEIVTSLEQALQIDSNNPLANHLYIHTMEASPVAEKAIPIAKRLASLVPDSGHLVHMPAHIYIRLGRYRDAVLTNQHAVKIDQGYLSHSHAESIYTVAYVPHNHHFLWAAAIKTGQQALATKAAVDTASLVTPELILEPGFSGTLQHFYILPLYTKALFGEWDAILKEPAPATDLVYPKGIWHYARGLAMLRKGKSNEALREREMLQKIISDPAIAELTIFDLNPVKLILQIAAEILHGEYAAQGKNYDLAISHLNRAVDLEDGLNYTEPKDWYLPPRQVLGAVLLSEGRAEEAERVYLKDLEQHPQNGWSLFGLAQSLKAQNKNNDSQSVQHQFEIVWADADVTLTNSRF